VRSSIATPYSRRAYAGLIFSSYRHELAGAGGWGDPFARDPERVLRDVMERRRAARSACTWPVARDPPCRGSERCARASARQAIGHVVAPVGAELERAFRLEEAILPLVCLYRAGHRDAFQIPSGRARPSCNSYTPSGHLVTELRFRNWSKASNIDVFLLARGLPQ